MRRPKRPALSSIHWLIVRRIMSAPSAIARRDAKLNRLMRPARVRLVFSPRAGRAAAHIQGVLQ